MASPPTAQPSEHPAHRLRAAVERMCEQALAAGARRPTPLEVRATADEVYVALEDYIDRRVSELKAALAGREAHPW